MAGIATNPDLPLSWRRPGTYVYFNLNSPGAAPGKRLLLLGELATSALRPANALYRVNSEQDVIDGAGPNSVLRPMYNDVIAQVGGGVCETWIGQVSEAGSGTVSVYTFIVSGPATSSGQFNWSLMGKTASVGFANGDSATSIAAAMATAATLAFATLPVATVTATTGTITLTLKTKAAWGEDLASVFYVTPNKGVTVGGTYLFTTNATSAGSAQITCGRSSYSFTLAGGETPTQIAAGLAALIVGDGPLASGASTGTLTVTFNNGWAIRHVVGVINTSTGTTITVNGGSPVAAGTTAPNGTIGLGSPTLTTLLTSIDGQALAYKGWVGPWNDVTTLGTIDSQIETEGGGLQCRGQTLTTASSAALATAGTIPTGTSPALTASVRAVVAWTAYDSANPAFEYAARIAAAKVVTDRPAQNFNGLVLKSTPAAPLLGPPPSGRSPSSDINAAINSYFMAPIVWNDSLGRPVVEHSRTTSNSSDRALHKWSLIAQLDAQRDDAIIQFNARFREPDGTGVSLMLAGTPFSEGIVTLDDFTDLMYELTAKWERLGFYDGADALKAGIQAAQDSSDPSRINVVYTASALVDLDIASIVGNRGSAAQ